MRASRTSGLGGSTIAELAPRASGARLEIDSIHFANSESSWWFSVLSLGHDSTIRVQLCNPEQTKMRTFRYCPLVLDEGPSW
jgi:hypothetical protein